jgi:alpha-galactosidase
MGAHVTSWNKAVGIKFRVDVAMMCKFSFDISLKELNPEERACCQNAVAGYNPLKNDILRYLYRTAKATGSGKKEYQNILFQR